MKYTCPILWDDYVHFEQDFYVNRYINPLMSRGFVSTGNNDGDNEIKVFWDTGTTRTSISYPVAKLLKLIPEETGSIVYSAHGPEEEKTVKINFIVESPDESYRFVCINRIVGVHGNKDYKQLDMLLGLDCISTGNFSLTRTNNHIKLIFNCNPI